MPNGIAVRLLVHYTALLSDANRQATIITIHSSITHNDANWHSAASTTVDGPPRIEADWHQFLFLQNFKIVNFIKCLILISYVYYA